MIPPNQEHHEAAQENANAERAKFMASISEVDREKFAAIDKAVKILVDAKVLFYLFPLLPYQEDSSKEIVWQWNSLMANIKYDDIGKPTPESDEMNIRYHNALFSAFYNQFYSKYEDKDFYNTLIKMSHLFSHCLGKQSEYLKDNKNEENIPNKEV